eukprot:166771-Pelagomonas_calceolata.AAC.3
MTCLAIGGCASSDMVTSCTMSTVHKSRELCLPKDNEKRRLNLIMPPALEHLKMAPAHVVRIQKQPETG